MKKTISFVFSICILFNILTGCATNDTSNDTNQASTTTLDANDYLEFLDEFSVNDVYGQPHHYFIVHNISDVDMDFALYGEAYDEKDKKIGLVSGCLFSLSPDDTYILSMSSADLEQDAVIDHVDVNIGKFFMDDNANTIYGFDTHYIEYSDTLEEETVYITATNNGDVNAHVNGAVIFYKDNVPVMVRDGLICNDYDEDDDFIIPPGKSETGNFRCTVDFDDYKVYIYAHADF